MKKILIIDDEKPTLNMCRLLFDALGYEVLTAENGTEGLEIFAAEKPPIVLTDVKMPGPDGFAVLTQIKALAPVSYVIVVTGHGDQDLMQKAYAHKADDFLSKPLNLEVIEAALRRAEQSLSR